MLNALLLMALAAGQPVVKLGAAPFQRAGISAETATLVQDTLAARLAEKDWIQVVTPGDIAAALGLERQKQLLGCAEEATSCAAELAGALGVDGLLTGSIGRVGSSFQLNVKIVSAGNAQAMFVYASKVLTTEDALLAEATHVAEAIAARFPDTRAGASGAGGNWQPWLLIGGGAAVAAAGGVFAGLAKANLDALGGTLPSGSTPEAVRDAGKLYQGLSIGFFAAGGVALAAGVIWKIAAPKSPVTAIVAPAPGGGSASIRIELP